MMVSMLPFTARRFGGHQASSGTMKRRIFLTVIGCLLLLSGGQNVDAASESKDQGDRLLEGAFENTMVGTDGNVTLGYDEALQNEWSRLADGIPSGGSVVYDSADKVLVLYDGTETWTYDFSTGSWKEMRPESSPDVDNFAMAYAGAEGVVVLFNCDKHGSLYSETWTYNVTQDCWAQKAPANMPRVRLAAGMAYDSRFGEVMMFEGYDLMSFDQPSNDTWAYDVGDDTWTKMLSAGGPSPRFSSAMAYDPESGEMVLFGGMDHDGPLLSDTWTYNFTENAWTSVKPLHSPPARWGHSMAYDRGQKGMVLFGGRGASSQLDDIWTYNSTQNDWRKEGPTSHPSARYDASMAFVPDTGQTVLYGGQRINFSASVSYRLNDLWTYDHGKGSWSQKLPPCPDGSYGAAMAYDASIGETILFGGQDSTATARQDTCSYDMVNGKWTFRNTGIEPPARSMGAMAYDSVHGVSVLFGGYDGSRYLNDTWTYNGSSNIWMKVYPPKSPSVRAGHAMVYDRARGLIVLFGGYNWSDGPYVLNSETWTFDAGTEQWTNRTAATRPPARRLHAMAYDTANAVTVLFGGIDSNQEYLGDTWTYNASSGAWRYMEPSGIPARRMGHAMAFDRASGLVVMFGGYSDPGIYFGETWTYSVRSNAWSECIPSSAPTGRERHSMAYDERGGALVLFGGYYYNYRSTDYYIRSDLWAFDPQRYCGLGTYTSPVMYFSGNASFGALDWDAALPPGTTLRFQLRTANCATFLEDKAFIGPDGTGASFYGTSGDRISGVHNGSSQLQYKAYMSSADPTGTPVLRTVTVNYNLPPRLAITSPRAKDEWSDYQDISWNIIDADNDPITFDIYVENNTKMTMLAAGLPNGTRHWTWDTTQTTPGSWRIRVVAHDNAPSMPTSSQAVSGNFKVVRSAPPNITSRPLLEVEVGREYNYTVKAVDAEGGLLTYQLVEGPPSMSIDPAWGRILYLPKIGEIGNHTVTILAFNARGGFDRQSFTLSVIPRYDPPTCRITSPQDGSSASGSVKLRGVAIRGTAPLTCIQVRIDDGDWLNASGLEEWTLPVAKGTLPDGRHTIRARALDGTSFSANDTVTFYLTEPAPGPSAGGSPWTLPVVAMAAVVGLAAFLLWRRKTGPRK